MAENIDVPAWITRIQEYVANPPVGAAPLDDSFERTMEVMEATKPPGLDLHTLPFTAELGPLLQAYPDALEAQAAAAAAAAAAAQAPAPAGQGGRRRRKTNRRHARKRTHRRRS